MRACLHDADVPAIQDPKSKIKSADATATHAHTFVNTDADETRKPTKGLSTYVLPIKYGCVLSSKARGWRAGIHADRRKAAASRGGRMMTSCSDDGGDGVLQTAEERTKSERVLAWMYGAG